MKKSVSILVILSVVLTAVGAVSMVFSLVTSLLFPVGLSLGFGAVMYNILGKKERNRIPKWLNVLLVLSCTDHTLLLLGNKRRNTRRRRKLYIP